MVESSKHHTPLENMVPTSREWSEGTWILLKLSRRGLVRVWKSYACCLEPNKCRVNGIGEQLLPYRRLINNPFLSVSLLTQCQRD